MSGLRIRVSRPAELANLGSTRRGLIVSDETLLMEKVDAGCAGTDSQNICPCCGRVTATASTALTVSKSAALCALARQIVT
eukprot:XP_001708974.1 Hypothetical protein GL50803_92096 [Giardia lamblia ATCC 50803]